MTASDLLLDLSACGIALSADGEHLRVNAPQGALTPELRESIRERKPELLALLQPPLPSPPSPPSLPADLPGAWTPHRRAALLDQARAAGFPRLLVAPGTYVSDWETFCRAAFPEHLSAAAAALPTKGEAHVPER